MKKLIYILSLFSILCVTSCTDDFDEKNRPKTGSSTTSPDEVFTRSLVTGSGLSYQVWQQMHQTTTSEWVQHWANIVPRFRGDNYEPELGDVVWKYYYSRQYFAPLSLNFQTMKLIDETDKSPLKMACAKIWNVYLFHLITDSYGDIPYSEAFHSLKPKFDSQQYIYEDMLKTLSGSVELIKANQSTGYIAFGKADVLYQGDMNKWIKFANALTLRLSLRISNVAPQLAQSYISKIKLDEVISSNAESAFIRSVPEATAGGNHEIKNAMGFVYGWQEVRLSENFMEHLDGTKFGIEDPRLKQFAEKTKANGSYKGLKNGQESQVLAGDPDFFKENYSNIGPYFNSKVYEVPVLLLTNSETQFLLAEAQLKGWLVGGKSAEEYYKAGIEASMDQYARFWDGTTAITADEKQNYVNAPGVTFDSSKALEQIITQKWISLYTNGQEAWSEMRRTGFPKIHALLDPYPGNTEMPRRRLYSSDEQKYNKANIEAAIKRMGGDSQYTRVWWDGGK